MERRAVSEIRHELDLAKAVASGELPSPSEWGNSKYYRVRISGVGCAWRAKNREYCYRPASIWLAPEMVQRVAGLALVSEHPPTGILNGRTFYERIVGICVLGFVEGDELWAVCRIIDDGAAEILNSGEYDTSPACSFDPDQNTVLQLGDAPLLLEGNPNFLDHVALVAAPNKGVWNRDGELGVEISSSEKELENA
jgi:colicin import membrane protein